MVALTFAQDEEGLREALRRLRPQVDLSTANMLSTYLGTLATDGGHLGPDRRWRVLVGWQTLADADGYWLPLAGAGRFGGLVVVLSREFNAGQALPLGGVASIVITNLLSPIPIDIEG
jgi:hypothetical protein